MRSGANDLEDEKGDISIPCRMFRGPMMSDCEEYNFDGTESCVKCQWLYTVGGDGWTLSFDYVEVVYVIVTLFSTGI